MVETTCSVLVMVESHSVVVVERHSVLVESMVVGAGLTCWVLVEAHDCAQPDHLWVALSGVELQEQLGDEHVGERHS